MQLCDNFLEEAFQEVLARFVLYHRNLSPKDEIAGVRETVDLAYGPHFAVDPGSHHEGYFDPVVGAHEVMEVGQEGVLCEHRGDYVDVGKLSFERVYFADSNEVLRG